MKIVARNYDGETHERVCVDHVCTAESYIDGSSCAKVHIFKTNESWDDGGIIIKLEIGELWFNPYVKQLDYGCEIHIAGACEAAQMIKALKAAMQIYN